MDSSYSECCHHHERGPRIFSSQRTRITKISTFRAPTGRDIRCWETAEGRSFPVFTVEKWKVETMSQWKVDSVTMFNHPRPGSLQDLCWRLLWGNCLSTWLWIVHPWPEMLAHIYRHAHMHARMHAGICTCTHAHSVSDPVCECNNSLASLIFIAILVIIFKSFHFFCSSLPSFHSRWTGSCCKGPAESKLWASSKAHPGRGSGPEPRAMVSGAGEQ